MRNFVLIHGAMHGGWCWRRVVPFLREAGAEVFAPTMTGMGERAHLISTKVDMHTHVQDIIGLLTYEDLTDVVLVGHSYAGMVITAVAEVAAERLAHLVYLDAFTPHGGESALDLEPPATAEAFQELACTEGDGWLLVPMKPAGPLGLVETADRRWVFGKLCAPLPCFQQPVSLPKRAAATLLRTYRVHVSAQRGIAALG